MSSQSKPPIPVTAGKVGVFYNEHTKIISHFASFPNAGNIISNLSVILADDDESLQAKMAEEKLIQKP
jgi:hypothetical protein